MHNQLAIQTSNVHELPAKPKSEKAGRMNRPSPAELIEENLENIRNADPALVRLMADRAEGALQAMCSLGLIDGDTYLSAGRTAFELGESRSARAPQSVRQIGRATLRYKPKKQYPNETLPFVGGTRGAWSYWDVPLTGGYGSRHAGTALAQILLKHLRQQPEASDQSISLLQGIFGDMMRKARSANDAEMDSLEWQLYGFMLQIAPCIVGAAHHGFHAVDSLDPRALLKRANAGLNHKPGEE